MVFHLASSWRDRGLQLQAVKDKCKSIIQQLDLPKIDARAQALIQVRQLCNTLGAVPIKLQQNAEIASNLPVVMAILGLQNARDVEAVLGDLNKNAKVSFVTMVQFALENCVDRILHALTGQQESARFSTNSKKLIELAGLDRPGKKHELMLVLAWIRNTFHAGGVHRKSTKTILIGGEQYKFEKGETLMCGSWSHLFHATDRSLDVYAEILLSAPVARIERIEAE